MPNTPQRLVDRFLAISGDANVQSDANTGLANAAIDTRYRAEITMSEVIERQDVRDCRNEFLVDEKIRTRGLRLTLNYTDVTPQLIAIWLAYHMGSQSGPTGSPANEVQTLTDGGTDGTIAMTLEGRTVTTRNIPTGSSAAEIQGFLTEARMLFIQPGDVVVTGTGPFTITFPNTGRLGRANLPTMVGTGGMSVAASVNGAQHEFDLAFSTDREKQRFSFIMGWENVTDRFEKYVGFVTESVVINAERRQNVSMTVTIFGPWEPEILDNTYVAPACTNPDALVTDDCRVLIDSIWETLDINTLNVSLNDSVPVDASAAYGFDSIDVQTLERGDQPVYDITGSVFASQGDNIYDKALNERTEDPVPLTVHYGMPGNRVSVIVDDAKLKFQDNRIGFAGTLNKSVVNFQATPYRLGATFPVEAEAFLDQATAFLVVSP